MPPKFIIFVVVSALFVASIYSLSSSVVSATTTTCSKVGKKTNCTVVSADDNGNIKVNVYTCSKNPDGKTYHCEEVQPTSPPSSLSTAINDAIVKQRSGTATGTNSGENNTHITNGNIVKSGGTLKSNIGPDNPIRSPGNDTLQ